MLKWVLLALSFLTAAFATVVGLSASYAGDLAHEVAAAEHVASLVELSAWLLFGFAALAVYDGTRRK